MTAPYKTLGESMRDELKRKKCPNLNQCIHIVTHDFFNNICTKPKYLACLFYAKSIDETETPMTWLQRNAVSLSTPE